VPVQAVRSKGTGAATDAALSLSTFLALASHELADSPVADLSASAGTVLEAVAAVLPLVAVLIPAEGNVDTDSVHTVVVRRAVAAFRTAAVWPAYLVGTGHSAVLGTVAGGLGTSAVSVATDGRALRIQDATLAHPVLAQVDEGTGISVITGRSVGKHLGNAGPVLTSAHLTRQQVVSALDVGILIHAAHCGIAAAQLARGIAGALDVVDALRRNVNIPQAVQVVNTIASRHEVWKVWSGRVGVMCGIPAVAVTVVPSSLGRPVQAASIQTAIAPARTVEVIRITRL